MVASAIYLSTLTPAKLAFVLVEAMNYGCVPVAFNSYAAADIIDDGENGILVPPMDCEKYANALAALMRDSARRERMAQAAMKRANSLSASKIAERWENLLKILR